MTFPDVTDLLEAHADVNHVLGMHVLLVHPDDGMDTARCDRCWELRRRRQDIKTLTFPFLYGRSRVPA